MSRRHDFSNRLESYLTLASLAFRWIVTNVAESSIMQGRTSVCCREEQVAWM